MYDRDLKSEIIRLATQYSAVKIPGLTKLIYRWTKRSKPMLNIIKPLMQEVRHDLIFFQYRQS